MGITSLIRILTLAAPVMVFIFMWSKHKIELRATVKATVIEQTAMCELKIAEVAKGRNNAALDFVKRANEAANKVGSTPVDFYQRCLLCKRSHSCQSRSKILNGEIKCEDFKPSPQS